MFVNNISTRIKAFTDFQSQINGHLQAPNTIYIQDQKVKFKDYAKNITKRATAIRGVLNPVPNCRSPATTKIICLQLGPPTVMFKL